jgi:hypothetical protein
MQGKQVMSLTLNGQSTVEISSLPSGLYQLVGEGKLIGKFVKE